MENEATDKKHEASGKRIAELKKRGTVMRSRDLSSGLIFIVSILVVWIMAIQFKLRLEENFILAFGGIKQVINDQDYFSKLIYKIVLSNFEMMLPFFCILLIAVFLSPFLFGGWNFTLEVIQFKFDKLNLIENIKKLFSPGRAGVEIVKSMFKTFFLVGVLIAFVLSNKNQIVKLLFCSPKVAILSSYAILQKFVLLLVFSIIVIILFDVIYHFFHFQSQTKMTTQEVKDEYKDAEGSVEVKRKIRSTQLAMLRQRIAQAVPKATVVVVNPTHYAVALRYDEKKDRAPKMIAKGMGMVAQQIRHLAISNGIPIYEAPPLARAIYFTTKIGAEVHPDLYMAVAIVLSYVHQLKNYQIGIGQLPKRVDDLQIPDSFVYEES